jgi:DNA-binding transcriptional LysR family regulator
MACDDLSDGRRDAEAHRALYRVGVGGDRGAGILDHAEDCRRPVGQQLSGGRRHHAASVPGEERNREFILEQADLPAEFRSLAGRPLILPGPRHGLRKLLEAAAREHDIALRVIVEADALQTLKDLVVRGLGYTVLPLAAVHAQVEAGELSAIAIRSPTVTRKMVLVRSLARPETNAVRIFADTLKAETAAMVRQGIWEGSLLFDGTPPK